MLRNIIYHDFEFLTQLFVAFVEYYNLLKLAVFEPKNENFIFYYVQKSLEVHPDRVGEVDRDLCTKKFQCIGAVYAILTDEGRLVFFFK